METFLLQNGFTKKANGFVSITYTAERQIDKIIMNGKTNENSILNPCSAAMDKATWGCKFVNVSFYGKRLFRLKVWRIVIDAYLSRGFLFSKGGGANGSNRYWQWFTPIGCIMWLGNKTKT